jgi:hypothetical protein
VQTYERMGPPRMTDRVKTMGGRVLRILSAVVSVYLLVSGALFGVMLQTPDRFAGTMKYVPWPAFVVLPFKPLWNVARKGHLAVGEMAPDFSLETTDHKGTFQLSSMRGQKPVVLVFGSYT